ncbi:MAG: Gfo/Idh/MocA family protein, partial [Chthoniobacterales bacterium]
MKVLLLGTGRWGTNHLRNLHAMPVEIYVAETDNQRLDAARKLGISEDRLALDYRTLAGKMDCVVVVTPAQTHFSLCREFLESGVDVFVEKPITLVSQEARELAELA